MQCKPFVVAWLSDSAIGRLAASIDQRNHTVRSQRIDEAQSEQRSGDIKSVSHAEVLPATM